MGRLWSGFASRLDQEKLSHSSDGAASSGARLMRVGFIVLPFPQSLGLRGPPFASPPVPEVASFFLDRSLRKQRRMALETDDLALTGFGMFFFFFKQKTAYDIQIRLKDQA